MNSLSATVKGFVTGCLMIFASLIIYHFCGSFDNNCQYIVYAMYVVGIFWTLRDFDKSKVDNKTFKNYFSQGFKCFIVITLLMVVFTWIFIKLNPGLQEDMAQNYREGLIRKGNLTNTETEGMVLNAKKYFIIVLTSMAIFGYLVIGALVTAITSAIFAKRKRTQ